MLKILYVGCLGLSPAISSQFSVEMCAASKNCEKFTKNPISGVQGRSKSSMLINLKSKSSVLVMISSMSVPICSHFRTIRANSSKITSFRGYPCLTLSFKGNPFTQGNKILSQQTRVLGAANSEHFVILVCIVLIQYSSVWDGETDEQTDTSTMAKKHEALHAAACKNCFRYLTGAVAQFFTNGLFPDPATIACS